LARNPRFQLKDKLLVLRLHRISHLPPALYATQMLNEQGFPVLVLEFGRIEEDIPTKDTPVPRVRIGSPWTQWVPRRLRPLAIFVTVVAKVFLRLLSEGKPQLVVAHGMQEQCLAYLLNFFFRIPVVVQVHEAYEPHELDRFNRFFLAFGSLALRESKFLIFPEETRAKIYVERYQTKAPIHLVYNCPRRRFKGEGLPLRATMGLPANSKLMAFVGGIGRENALEDAIVALVEVPTLHFLVWGWGEPEYLSSLNKLAREFGVTDRVHFLGELNETKWATLDGCDLSYCVYRPERLRLRYAATASNKLMESMAAGLPTLTNGNPDFRAIVEGNDVGVCVDFISSGQVAEKIRLLLKDEVGFQRRGQNGLRQHQTVFNYEHQFSAVIESFARICKRKAESSGTSTTLPALGEKLA